MSRQTTGAALLGSSNALSGLVMAAVFAEGAPKIDVPVIHGGTLQAYFLGISISILLLLRFRHRTWLFTAIASLSLILAASLLPRLEDRIDGTRGMIVFILLSLGFAGCFAARSLRIKTAGVHRKVPWVDIPHHLVWITSLFTLPRMQIVFQQLLTIGCALLAVASCIDALGCGLLQRPTGKGESTLRHLSETRVGTPYYWALAVILLTTAIQGSLAIFASQSHLLSPSVVLTFATDMLAASYVGAAMGALVSSVTGARICRGTAHCISMCNGRLTLPIYSIAAAATCLMSISLVTGQFGRVYTALGLIAAGVVAFQIAAIPILHEIAILTPNSPYLQYSYCVMGFAVFLAMAIGSHVSSVIGICGFAAIVTLGAIWAVRRA